MWRSCAASAAVLAFAVVTVPAAVPPPRRPAVAASREARDVRYFLHRLRTVDHLPELEDSHTALASTWDRSGGNADGTDYRRVEATKNVLLDVDGPGCIHRLFTGASERGRADMPAYLRVDGTRLQVFVDGSRTPVFDFLVVDFFDPVRGPFPGPLAGDKAHGWTYPGSLFPIPFRRHCRVQLTNPKARNWGCYWQIAYTTYPKGTPVETLAWPLPPPARAELDAVRRAWRAAQSAPPVSPVRWTVERAAALSPGESLELQRSGCEVIREMRLGVSPSTPDVLRRLRLTMRWDGEREPSVDVPVGHFFGNAFTGHLDAARFSTLLLGIGDAEAYARFPMPYARGAVIALRNDSQLPISDLRLALDVQALPEVPSSWGRFHATYVEARAAESTAPRLGPRHVPGPLVLEHAGRGKYVGVVMSEDWPHEGWWGEGDWLIWTDDAGWPPRYHGTGSEEYFNSGWCLFDRKAISGYVAVHPGHPTQYSFHLNDAFQFQKNVRVVVETMGWDKADQQIRDEHPVWRSTAFWYAAPVQPEQAAAGPASR
jgi:hypothetical protein